MRPYLTALLLVPASALAAPSEIEIRVRIKGSGEIVRHADVAMGATHLFSDGKGIVKIPATFAGKHAIIGKAGFDDLEIDLQTPSDAGMVDYYLIPANDSNGTTVVVTGEQDLAASRKNLSKEELDRVSPGDPAKALKFMPGVQERTESARPARPQARGGGGGRGGGGFGGRGGGVSPPTTAPTAPAGAPGGGAAGGPGGGGNMAARMGGSSLGQTNAGLIIRGSSPAESKYYIDDIEVPYLFHNIDDLSIIPGALVQSIQFDSGGFSARYGNAMGGIVVINTLSDQALAYGGEATINIPYYGGAFYRGPVGDNSSLSVSYRRSYVDYFLKQYYDSVDTSNPSSSGTQTPVFSDAHIQYLHKSGDGSTNKVTLLGTQDGDTTVLTQRARRSATTSTTSSQLNSAATLAWEQTGAFNEKARYRLTPQGSFVRGTTDSGSDSTKDDQWASRMPTEFTLGVLEHTDLILGADPNYKSEKISATTVMQNQSDGTSTSTSTVVRREVGNPATWLGIDTTLGRVRMEPQMRGFYNTQIKRYSVDPRFNSSYKIMDTQILKASVGRFSMAPSATQATENHELAYQRTYQYIAGIESPWTQDFSTEIQGFLKEGYHIITSDPVTHFNNNARSEVWGVEFMARKNFTGRWFAFGSYTYSKTRVRQAADQPFKRTSTDQTHVASLAASYKLATTWEVAGAYHYNTGDTYSPVSGSTYNSITDSYNANSSSTEKNLPPIQSVSAYLTKDFLFDTWKLQARGGMESYWYKAQVTGMTPNYDSTSSVKQTSLANVPFLEVKGIF